MPDPQRPPSARQMPTIPPEISFNIAQHLDRKSSLSLMRTCRALRPAGEMGVYGRLNLTGSWDPDPVMACRNSSQDAIRIRGLIVDAKLRVTLSALQSNPHLLEFINTLIIEPSDGVVPNRRAQSLLKLISRVADRIQRLDVIPVLPAAQDEWDPATRAELGCERFYTALNISSFNFPRLVHLRFAHQSRRAPVVDIWMERLTKLETLHYSSSTGSFGTRAVELPSTEPFLDLHSLTFDHLYDVANQTGLDFLAVLLELAPNLGTLRLRGQWRPRKAQRAMQALRKLKCLRAVHTLDEDYQSYRIRQGIACQRLGRVESGIEEMALAFGPFPEQEEFDTTGIPIPIAPALHRLTIMTVARPPLFDIAAVPIGPTPQHSSPLKARFLYHLKRAPLLSVVLFLHYPTFVPTVYGNNPIPELFVPPPRWVAEGYSGIVIRQYCEPGNAEDFWHLRCLTRAAVTPEGEDYVGARRVWHDQAAYKCYTVPRDVLLRMYHAAGMEPDFLVGGRVMSFGTKGADAWMVLHEWWDGLGISGDTNGVEGDMDSDIFSEGE